jgi:hypothetical protein
MTRARYIAIAIAAAAAAVALLPGGAAAANSTKAKKVHCTLELIALGKPNPSGAQFGFPSCPAPLGKGLHYSTYTVTPSSPTSGSIAGRFKNYYNTGTLRGTVAMTFSATSPESITYTGTVSYTGGTGAFKHVTGPGTITCTSTDGGAHKSCIVDSKLTGV